MKIRTITTGINLVYPVESKIIKKFAAFNLRAKKIFEKNGYEVQTTRISSQPWPRYLGRLPPQKITNVIKCIEDICKVSGVDFFNIGTAYETKHIALIPKIIKKTSRISCSATIGSAKDGINICAIKETAKVILKISKDTPSGYGNFRFAAIADCPPGIPFFPASYHRGKTSFSIGIEASDLVMRAFDFSKDLIDAEKNLKTILTHEYKKVEQIANYIGKLEGILFKGIDLSPSPSLKKSESIAYAFEKLGSGKFGSPGTLAIAGLVTTVLKSLKIKGCGYSGLMLPILEDFGLAKRTNAGLFNIDNILAYSSICGTGLDCIPLPGDISLKKISAILLDVASLSIKLNKPLSARLLPVPNKKAGQMTNFKSPYLIDCRIIGV